MSLALSCLCVGCVQASGVNYEDMLFFDNERWNITGREVPCFTGSIKTKAQQKQEVSA